MIAGARSAVSPNTAIASQMLTFWDQSWGKNLVASVLAFVWIGAGGYSLLPIGLLIALQLMLPAIPGWSLWRRLRFAGRRSVILVALAAGSFFFAHIQLGVLHPDGAIVYGRPQFLVPTSAGWLAAEHKDRLSTRHQACARGDAESCALLGRAYLEGKGVDPDPRAAVGYFESACDAGHSLACVSLGRMYSRGIGVDANRTTAKQLYAEACHAGEQVGCHNQGALQLSEGHFTSGMDALMRACSQDFGRSCYLVGEQFRLGTGGQRKSSPRARVWLEKACRLDVKEACDLVATVAINQRRG